MFSWRITKYNPANRDHCGFYLLNEWTSYSDIGKTIDGKKLTYKEYLKAEDSYVAAVILLMECNKLEILKVKNLEKNVPLDLKDKHLTEKMKDCYSVTKNNKEFDKNEIDTLCRLILRDKLWCKLRSTKMFVHFGWDYYMYIGSIHKCEECIDRIQKSGLFVEAFESPYGRK